jgi:hypothetical protein
MTTIASVRAAFAAALPLLCSLLTGAQAQVPAPIVAPDAEDAAATTEIAAATTRAAILLALDRVFALTAPTA